MKYKLNYVYCPPYDCHCTDKQCNNEKQCKILKLNPAEQKILDEVIELPPNVPDYAKPTPPQPLTAEKMLDDNTINGIHGSMRNRVLAVVHAFSDQQNKELREENEKLRYSNEVLANAFHRHKSDLSARDQEISRLKDAAKRAYLTLRDVSKVFGNNDDAEMCQKIINNL